jgi:cephalosporin-C deacetylase
MRSFAQNLVQANFNMKQKICLFMFTWFCHFFFGKSIANAQPVDLKTTAWRIKMEDNAAFATPQYEDSTWQTIAVGQPWENAVGNYDGIGWYRKTVFLDRKTLRRAVRCGGGMVLRLGKIDDADETYFNGVKIGSMGEFPPARVSAWDDDRVYIVPKKLINWDKPNVIAVRVADWGGGGGLYSGDYALEPLTWKQKMKINVTNLATTNAFDFNKQIGIATFLKNGSKENLGGDLTVEIRTFTGEKVAEQTRKVQILKGRELAMPPFSFDSLPVGFYHSTVRFQDARGNNLKEIYAFAVEPTQAKVPPMQPTDFDAFWQEARAELDAIAPEFKLTGTPQYSTSKTDVFEVEMRSLGNIRVRGYYAQPKNKTNLPALLHVQGYSSVMLPFDIDQPMAQFFLNIRGHGNSQSDLNPGFPGFLLKGLDSAKTYIYRGAYMDCIRAVDFLASRSEVDTMRIGVEGASQGGALSYAVAALDKRIKLCAPDVPFLSDFRNYFQIASWPAMEFKTYSALHFRKMETIYSVLDYFDIKHLTPMITCPVIMGVGLYDPTCPPAINFAAYNNLASTDKEYRLYPTAGHSLPPSHYEVKRNWIFKHFGMNP